MHVSWRLCFSLPVMISLAVVILGSDDLIASDVDKVGVVCHIRVIFDKVPEVSSLEALEAGVHHA
jgi:hypothetical protein